MACRQQMEDLREQMLPAITTNYDFREGTHYGVSSPVENAVINRMEGSRIQNLEQKIKRLEVLQEMVEISLDTMLTDEQRQVVKLIYFQKKPWQQICMELCIEKTGFYNRKNEILKILSWCFGYMPDEEVGSVLGLLVQDKQE